jgi:ribosome-binding protein aMBF1 (putative translation factor)
MGVRISNTKRDVRAREAVISSSLVESENPRVGDVATEGFQAPKVRGNGLLIPNATRGRHFVAEEIQRRFGDRVRETRHQKGISQESLALVCDLDRAYVGGVERGERNISLVNIYKIARGLGVPAKDLMP